jgi:hypothetical protein
MTYQTNSTVHVDRVFESLQKAGIDISDYYLDGDIWGEHTHAAGDRGICIEGVKGDSLTFPVGVCYAPDTDPYDGHDWLTAYDLSQLVRAVQTCRLAAAFTRKLHKELSPRELDAVRRANDRLAYDCCATHDYCDANMTMLEAWQYITGKDMIDVENEADAIMWNEAWDLAKADQFRTTFL